MVRRRDPQTARFIGSFIKKSREKKFPGRGGKAAAADSFGINRTSWGHWEDGTSIPDDVNQRKLAKFFGITLAELRGDHEKPPVTTGGQEGEILTDAQLAAVRGALSLLRIVADSLEVALDDPDRAEIFAAAIEASKSTLEAS